MYGHLCLVRSLYMSFTTATKTTTGLYSSAENGLPTMLSFPRRTSELCANLHCRSNPFIRCIVLHCQATGVGGGENAFVRTSKK